MRTPLLLAVVVLLAGCKKEAPPKAVADEKPVKLNVDGLGSTVQVRIGGQGAQPTLPFEIVTIYENHQPSEKPPFHSEGGKWTFFDAKLADGTEFTVGLFDRLKLQSDPPMTLVDASLIAHTNGNGEKLALAYAKAFNVKAPPPGKELGFAALKVNSVNLGENAVRAPGGGFKGEGGTWTASKWTIERAEHATEVYFNFSLAEKKGEWAQKDADYDADVAKDFMEVLHDGMTK